jgi:hypothetical protein
MSEIPILMMSSWSFIQIPNEKCQPSQVPRHVGSVATRRFPRMRDQGLVLHWYDGHNTRSRSSRPVVAGRRSAETHRIPGIGRIMTAFTDEPGCPSCLETCSRWRLMSTAELGIGCANWETRQSECGGYSIGETRVEPPPEQLVLSPLYNKRIDYSIKFINKTMAF